MKTFECNILAECIVARSKLTLGNIHVRTHLNHNIIHIYNIAQLHIYTCVPPSRVAKPRHICTSKHVNI
jgi:hypothetical protein